ncbi:MAG: DUF4286 family protein [Saprospiraceae bacterium]|nr:DUF4286 family protein [Saprospiraceae bacterium]MBP7699208.1 DUF4286 family protein [Saprospiraceae bacterium]
MILYNVTIKIETDLHEEWLLWMQQSHIPNVMRTGIFREYRLCRLLGDDETDGITYAIQYICDDLDSFRKYQDVYAPALQKEHSEKFLNRYVAFRTLLQVVEWNMYATQEMN